jgi:hypothetical protein
VYHAEGSWQEIVAGQLAFPPDAVERLREMWSEVSATADPLGWAQGVSDQLIS